MSESSAESLPEFELPPQPAEGERAAEQSVERAAPKEVSGNQTSAATAPPMPLPTTLPQLPVPQPASNVVLQAPAVDNSGLAASDADLIEKEWVDRAKAIVAKTQDDPYHQKKAISKVKAEYIQKRFNKTIKADDTAGP